MKKEILLTKNIVQDSFNDFFEQIQTTNQPIFSKNLYPYEAPKFERFVTKFAYLHYTCNATLSTFDAVVTAKDDNGLENKLLSEYLTATLQKSYFSSMTNEYGRPFISHMQDCWKKYFQTRLFGADDKEDLDFYDICFEQEEKFSELAMVEEMLCALN